MEDLELVKLRMSVELLEIGGLRSLFEALRLPYDKKCRSGTEFNFNCQAFTDFTHYYLTTFVGANKKDSQLIDVLISRGDEHAKCVRGLMYYLKITAPRWWWVEMDTYVVGTIPMGGTSTMHIDCKGMSGEELMAFKDNMPQGHLETRIRAFSLQTLQRIYSQRQNHRLLIWQEFCQFIESLPMSELIIGK